ncbi:MAG: hypothetical protein ABDH34_02665 [Dictyoglomus thermophilum]
MKNNSTKSLTITKLLEISLLFSALFLPPFKINSSLSLRLEDLIILIAFPVFIFREKLVLNSITKLILILGLVEFVSIVVNARLLVFTSMFELFKLLKFFLLIQIFYKSFRNHGINIRLFDYFFIFLIVFNLLQFFNFFGFNEYIGKLYTTEVHLEAFLKSETGVRRLLGLMGNPNNNAILFSFFSFFYINWYIISKNKKYLLFILLAIFFMMLSQSRTLFLAFMISIISSSLVINTNTIRGKSKPTRILLTTFLFISLLLIFLNLYYIGSLFNDPFETYSWRNRVLVWSYLYSYVANKILLGTGGVKELLYSENLYAESSYVWFLYNFGLISVLVYGLIFLELIYLSIKYKYTKFSYLVYTFSIVILISSITNAPFQEPRINLLIALTIAIFMYSWRVRDVGRI